MKTFVSNFLHRGLLSAAGGPLVLAIVYGILGATGAVSSLTSGEVCLGILTIIILAAVVGGMTAIYQVEKLPLATAILLHGAALYFAYILIYLVNGWLKSQLLPIAIFTGVFIVGYGLIWAIIYATTKASTAKINNLKR